MILILAVVFAASFAVAEEPPKTPDNRDGHCDRCGSCQCVRRVPVPKPVTKEEIKVCWDAECEDVIIPGPSCLCGKRHGKDDCGCFWSQLWKPTWAKVITKNVPVKREVVRKVPGFEWTVEERCCHCR